MLSVGNHSCICAYSSNFTLAIILGGGHSVTRCLRYNFSDLVEGRAGSGTLVPWIS